MSADPILTMYYDGDNYAEPSVVSAVLDFEDGALPETDYSSFRRRGAKRMSEWYKQFQGCDSVSQNEALIDALVEASEKGYARISADEGHYIVMNGDIPVEALVSSSAYENIYQIRGAVDIDELDSHLSERRIVLCYTASTEFMIDGEGRMLDVGGRADGTGGVSDFLSTIEDTDAEFLAQVREFVGDEAVRLAGSATYSR